MFSRYKLKKRRKRKSSSLSIQISTAPLKISEILNNPKCKALDSVNILYRK
uniref:Uncharacterized protein n=1 Tax=Nelumbo nucifera TaxID=4432 RepID=A0A822ZUG6_NELNU|nr:TPA_asm: hypothetical protein HUJ06_018550 [Nelumbo nucifera]